MTDQTRTMLRTVLSSDPDTAPFVETIIAFATTPQEALAAPEPPNSHEELEDRGKLLSCVEVAKLLHRTTMTIRRWVKEGKLTPAKVQGSSRIAGYFEKDVLAFIDSIRATA